MKFIDSETSLVVAGAWNPAIVTPEWILKYGLKKDLQEENRVQVFVPAGAGLIFEMPRFSFSGLIVTVRPDALVIAPKETTQAQFEQIEVLAANTVQELTHTPISGIGHNFEFRSENPSAECLGIFSNSYEDLIDAMPDDWSVAGSTLSSSMQMGATTVNVTRTFIGSQLSIKFNFHHPVVDGAQAISVLKGELGYKHLHQNLEIAKNLVIKIYGDLSDE